MATSDDKWLTPQQAADLLGTTAPTIRQLAKRGELDARVERRGSREFRWINPRAVNAFLEEYGSFSKHHSPSFEGLTSRIDGIERRLAAMESNPTGGEMIAAGPPAVTHADLTEALRLHRAASVMMREADEARANVIKSLMDALGASEVADEKRRNAVRGLETILDIVLAPSEPPADQFS